jgi:hypothetical protein
MQTIAQIVTQMPTNVSRRLPADAEDLAPLLTALYTEVGRAPRAIIIVLDERGWIVTVDGVVDTELRGRQAGSRGGWTSMRLALLVAILLQSRPELSIRGNQ